VCTTHAWPKNIFREQIALEFRNRILPKGCRTMSFLAEALIISDLTMIYTVIHMCTHLCGEQKQKGRKKSTVKIITV
jgi:hypothetical protein